MSNEITHHNQSLTLVPHNYAEAMEFSTMMAKADLLPPHLKGKPADCFRIVAQAARWGMDPFAVADKTSVISGKIMYEGQLTAAVINSRGNLKGRLRYDFDGDVEKPATLVLTVGGTIQGETEPRTIRLTYAQAKAINRNGQMDKNPEQQMCYIGARIWARRHMPELILGVYSPDEDMEDTATTEKPAMRKVEAVDETPEPAKERPAPPPKATKKAEPKPETVKTPEPDPEPEVTEPEPTNEPEDLELTSEPEPALTDVPVGKTITGVKVWVKEVSKIKIGGKEGLRLKLTGGFEGGVLSFEADKIDACTASLDEGTQLTMNLKGVRSTKNPDQSFVFAEEIQ